MMAMKEIGEDLVVGRKIQRFKYHLQKNKKSYLIGAGSLGVGVLLGASRHAEVKQTIDSFNFKFFSPTTTTLEQTVLLVRRGHPGNVILCIETGEKFASQNRAAQALGISSSNLSQHLKGNNKA